MTTLHQQLTDRYLAHLAGNPDAAYARKAFDAGAKAALEIVAGRVTRTMDLDDDDASAKPFVDALLALAREIA